MFMQMINKFYDEGLNADALKELMLTKGELLDLKRYEYPKKATERSSFFKSLSLLYSPFRSANLKQKTQFELVILINVVTPLGDIDKHEEWYEILLKDIQIYHSGDLIKE